MVDISSKSLSKWRKLLYLHYNHYFCITCGASHAMHHLRCVTCCASPLMHHPGASPRCIIPDASSSLHHQWWFTTDVSPPMHHPQCITPNASPPMYHLVCITYNASPAHTWNLSRTLRTLSVEHHMAQLFVMWSNLIMWSNNKLIHICNVEQCGGIYNICCLILIYAVLTQNPFCFDL